MRTFSCWASCLCPALRAACLRTERRTTSSSIHGCLVQEAAGGNDAAAACRRSCMITALEMRGWWCRGRGRATQLRDEGLWGGWLTGPWDPKPKRKGHQMSTCPTALPSDIPLWHTTAASAIHEILRGAQRLSSLEHFNSNDQVETCSRQAQVVRTVARYDG